MIAKLFTLATLVGAAFATFPAATTQNSCNVEHQVCCNSIQKSDAAGISQLLGLLNVATGPITGQVGVNCNPISVIGLNSNACNAQPACCTGNNFNGVIALGCSPLALTA